MGKFPSWPPHPSLPCPIMLAAYQLKFTSGSKSFVEVTWGGLRQDG